MEFGKPKYGFTKKKYFKIKDGEYVFGILPPMGKLAREGTWNVFYPVHYGYRNSKGKLVPFQSPEVINFKTKMVEVPDAANERLKKLKLQLEAAQKSGNQAAVEQLSKLVGRNKPVYNSVLPAYSV